VSTAQRLAKNTLVLSISNVAILLMGLLYSMYTARYLGPERYGIISFALAFTSIFGVFTDIGLNTLTVREVARNKELAKKYFGNLLLLKIILALISSAIIVVAINFLGRDKSTIEVVYLISLSIIIGAFTGIFNSLFQAFERIEFVSIGGLLNSVLMLLGAIFLINQGFGILGFACIYIFSSTIVLVCSLIIANRNLLKPTFAVDRELILPMIREAFPFGLTALSGMIYTYTDSIMLSIFQGNEVVGWYNASYRLVLMLLFIPNVINITIFPVMSRYFTSSEVFLKLLYAKYLKFLLILCIPIGIGTTLIADKIILFVFGEMFVNSIISLQILIWTIVITFAGAAFIKLLESTNKQRVVTKVSLICVVVNISLNLLLIPCFSYIGSSIATVVTELVLVGSVIFITYRLGYGIPIPVMRAYLLRILFSVMIMSVYLWCFRSLGLIVLILSSSIIYFIVLYLVHGIDNEDIGLLKLAIKR
jgi:O-antigen/teichoic acid export membrane protein